MSPISHHDNLDQDRDVVTSTLQGVTGRFAELVDRYQGPLRAALSYHCRREEDVEELLQQAFVIAYQRLSDFDVMRPFYLWLKTIAMNELRMRLRHQEVKRRHAGDYLRYVEAARLDQDDPGHEMQAEELSVVLNGCIKRLPEKSQKLLLEHYQDGSTMTELATHIGKSPASMRMVFLRLRETLRGCMEEKIGVEGGQA